MSWHFSSVLCAPNAGARATVGERGGDAVTAHHHGDTGAELAGEQVSEFARADEPDAFVLGHARVERPALVVHDAMRLPDLREADAGRRMRMHDAAHIGSGSVDARVDPELAVRRPPARENLAFAVQNQQRARAGEAGAAPRGHEKSVRAGDAGARVP